MPDPNLTLEPLDAKTVTRNGIQCARYRSLKACSVNRNIPVTVLRLAAKSNAPGIKHNGDIWWEELQPYLAENFTRLLAEVNAQENVAVDDDRTKWELRKLKAEVTKLENHNKAKSKDYISRKLVLKTVNQLYGNLFSQLSRYLLDESPAKCDGMNAGQLKTHNKEFLVRLFSSLKHQEIVWSNAADITPDETPTSENV